MNSHIHSIASLLLVTVMLVGCNSVPSIEKQTEPAATLEPQPTATQTAMPTSEPSPYENQFSKIRSATPISINDLKSLYSPYFSDNSLTGAQQSSKWNATEYSKTLYAISGFTVYDVGKEYDFFESYDVYSVYFKEKGDDSFDAFEDTFPLNDHDNNVFMNGEMLGMGDESTVNKGDEVTLIATVTSDDGRVSLNVMFYIIGSMKAYDLSGGSMDVYSSAPGSTAIISSDDSITQGDVAALSQLIFYETTQDGTQRTELFYDDNHRLVLDIINHAGVDSTWQLYHKFEYDAAGNCTAYSSEPEVPVELQMDQGNSTPITLSIYFDDGCTRYAFDPDGSVREETFDGVSPTDRVYSYERNNYGRIIAGTGNDSYGGSSCEVQCIYNDDCYGIPIATGITTAEHGLVLRDAPDGNKCDTIPYHTPVDIYMHVVGENDVQWGYVVYYSNAGEYCSTGYISTQYLEESYLA